MNSIESIYIIYNFHKYYYITSVDTDDVIEAKRILLVQYPQLEGIWNTTVPKYTDDTDSRLRQRINEKLDEHHLTHNTKEETMKDFLEYITLIRSALKSDKPKRSKRSFQPKRYQLMDSDSDTDSD